MRHWRVYLVLLALFFCGAALVGRLVFLQIMNGGFYLALAQGQQNLSSLTKGERGNVFLQDKNGNRYIVATNQEVPFVFASPPEVQAETMEETATKLSLILGLDRGVLLQKLHKEASLYELIKKRISKEEQEALQQAEISGVYIGKETVRSYPQQNLASHVIGFTNQEGKGQYGIEEYYNDVLEGKEGLTKSAKNPASYLLFGLGSLPQNGSDVVLTIDYHIQVMAESLLQEAEQKLRMEGGTIIVAEPSSGKILALAGFPTFNPNEYSQVENFRVFQDPAIQNIHEPGSIFKPITMAAALDTGKITPDTSYVDKGVVDIGRRRIANYGQRIWGQRTMTEVLEFSINTGAVFAEQQLGHENFLRYLKKFGIFEPTKIDLAGEVFSVNAEFQKGYEINFATASFGQGIEMTPLQILKAFSTIANNGVPVDPFVAEKVISSGGVVSEAHETRGVKKPIISPKTVSDLTAMMVSVVQNGFAKSANIPGYYVAGKTGTAEISWSALGIAKSGYSDKTVQSFIGYAPAFNPRFIILVKLDNPQTKTAEYSAVPIFRDLAQYIIDYYQIPPDYEVDE